MTQHRKLLFALAAALPLACGVSAPFVAPDAGDLSTDGGGIGPFALKLGSATPTREAYAYFAVQSCGTVSAVLINAGSIPATDDPAWQSCMAGGSISASLAGGMNMLQVWARGDDGSIYEVPGTFTVVRNSMFSLGDTHSCALVAGAVQCWGNNDNGQLGGGLKEAVSILPMPVTGLQSDVLEISGAPHANHSCALKADGTVWCWGANDIGQLGNATVTTPCSTGTIPCSNVPVQVMQTASEPITGAVQIVVGSNHACAALQSGEVLCWGVNDVGEAMDGHVLSGATPWEGPTPTVALPAGALLTAGVSNTCAWTPSGALCAGLDYTNMSPVTDGPLAAIIGGSGDQACADGWPCNPTPTQPQALQGLAAPTQVVLGYYHACALVQKSVLCWGANSLGQYGDGSTNPGTGGGVVSLSGQSDLIAAGAHHTCARATDSSVSCWGLNDFGQLGAMSTTQCATSQGPVSCALKPVTVPLQNAAALAAGRRQSCAAAAGKVWCWGGNESGELGANATENCASENGSGNGAPALCSHAPVTVLDLTAAAP